MLILRDLQREILYVRIPKGLRVWAWVRVPVSREGIARRGRAARSLLSGNRQSPWQALQSMYTANLGALGSPSSHFLSGAASTKRPVALRRVATFRSACGDPNARLKAASTKRPVPSVRHGGPQVGMSFFFQGGAHDCSGRVALSHRRVNEPEYGYSCGWAQMLLRTGFIQMYHAILSGTS